MFSELHYLPRRYTINRVQVGVGTGFSPSTSVGLSVWWVDCGKTADWIWMPFGAVSVVSRGMGE